MTDLVKRLLTDMRAAHKRLGFMGDEPEDDETTTLYGVSATYGELKVEALSRAGAAESNDEMLRDFAGRIRQRMLVCDTSSGVIAALDHCIRAELNASPPAIQSAPSVVKARSEDIAREIYEFGATLPLYDARGAIPVWDDAGDFVGSAKANARALAVQIMSALAATPPQGEETEPVGYLSQYAAAELKRRKGRHGLGTEVAIWPGAHEELVGKDYFPVYLHPSPSLPASALTALKAIKARADSGGRRLETAPKACEDIEAMCDTLIAEIGASGTPG